jgi:predicted MPP superfamily phosphohydrolase
MTRLEIKANRPLQIRHTSFPYRGDPIPVLYASDIHLNGNTEHISRQILQAILKTQPAVVLLGGDLVDRTRALPELEAFVRAAADICPVAAIVGNHDAWAGNDRVRDCMNTAGAHWLRDKSYRVSHEIQVDGSCQAHLDKHCFSILCAHYPAVFRRAAQAGYRLVLAGHLHGGQCVIGHYRGRMYPGALISRWNGDVFREGSTTMLVIRGANDILPIRWNCPREVLVCEIGTGSGNSST